MDSFKKKSRDKIRIAVQYWLLLTASLFIFACGHSRVSLQPDIQSARPAGLSHKSGGLTQPDKKLQRKLPKMTAAEYESLGDSLMAQGTLETAYLNYDKASRLDRQNAMLEYKKGLALLKFGNAEAAVKQFRLALDKKLNFALAHEGMGRALFMQHKMEASKTYFLQAVTLDDTLWQSYNCLGAIYDKQRLRNEAVAAYKKAIAAYPDNGMIYNNLGVSYVMDKRYEHAYHAFRNAIMRGFATPKTYNNMGLTLAHLGRYTAAFEAFKAAGGEARAYNNLGCYFMGAGKVQKAIAYFEKAIGSEPKYYVEANENLKRAHIAGGKR